MGSSYRTLSTGLYAIVLGTIVAMVASSSQATTMFTPPTDSAEADRVRIWLPLERKANCRVELIILNDSGQVVRTMLDDLLKAGYYNLYWDKRDDSGAWVPSGEYLWQATDCRGVHEGTVEAVYQHWERESSVWVAPDTLPSHFHWRLDDDSARVTLLIENHRGRRVDSLFADSLMTSGTYHHIWTPPQGYAGRFVLKLSVGDWTHSIPFLVPPGRRQQ